MRFKIESYEEQLKRSFEIKSQWHSWFAWRPIVLNIECPTCEIVWLERVARKYEYDTWIYSDIDDALVEILKGEK